MKIKFGVVVFPGSNCDHDAYYVIKKIFQQDCEFLWHKEHTLKNCDVVILPGGFSYGDYLRSGAIARFSPIMQEIISFAEKGGLVLGICNGFQILTESQLLPGVLLRNNQMKFICKDVYLTTTNNNTRFTNTLQQGQVLKIPIAHGEGNYFIDSLTEEELKKNNQIVFRYSDKNGEVSDNANPNGSVSNIAGVINTRGNVLGMMPHPERCADARLGNTDGAAIFQSIIKSFLH